MKQKILYSCLLFTAFTIVFFACKKDTFHDSVQADNATSITKVSAWLDAHQYPKQPNKAANVRLLKENLDFSNMRTEQSDDNEKLLIVPVKDDLKIAKKLDSKSIVTLVVIVNKLGAIRKANVVLYTPAQGQSTNKLPDNTFPNILNTGENIVDGKFTYLDITGRLLYKLNYKGGTIASRSEITRTPPANANVKTNGVKTNSVCIEWWETTTIIIGNVTTYSTEYVGESCYGCDGGDYEALCPPGEGAGGDTEDSYEYTELRYATWLAVDSALHLTAKEKYKGKRVSTETQGGHFKSGTSYEATAPERDVLGHLQIDSWPVSVSGQTASSSISGNFYWWDASGTQYYSNSNTFSFSTVFP